MDEASPLSRFWPWQKVDGRHRYGWCYLCARPARSMYPVCGDCYADLPRRPDAYSAAADGPGAVDAWLLPFAYSFPFTVLLRRAKFHRDLGALESCMAVFSAEVSAYSRWLEQYDLLVPVPLSSWRFVGRGFNQSAVLARGLATTAGIQVAHDVARRRGHQRPQSALDARARQENVRNIFSITRRLDNVAVLVVDDVVTTGATVRSLARALRQSGAASVAVTALAATPA